MPVLEYRTPRVFLSGVYSYRKVDTAGSASVLLVIGVVLVWTFGPWTAAPNTLGFGAGSVIFTIAVYVLVMVGIGRRVATRITSDGVDFDGRHYPWSDIHKVGAVSSSGELSIFVEIQGRSFPVTLMMSPSIKFLGFNQLVADLRREVVVMYPHLELEAEPRVDRGSGG